MRYISVVLFVIFMVALPSVYRSLSGGFRIDKLLLTEGGEGAILPEELVSCLTQDFRYLAQGTQSYVFESRDKKYVLKLFRFEQTTNPIYRFIREKIRGKALRSNLESQKNRLFTACRLADLLLREETALVALHLEQTKGIWPTVKLRLPLGRTHEVALDQCCFALQEKGERIYPSLLSSFQNSEQMKRKLTSFYALLKSRSEKGIGNRDSDLHRNFGFVKDRAIEIDFGAYYRMEDEEAKKEIDRFASPLRCWLLKRSEEWFLYWDSIIKKER